jgi:hypothetical protein
MVKKETGTRKKGCCLWFALIGLVLVAAVVAMPLLRICPPKGPWPTPPWCISKDDCTDYPATAVDGLIRSLSDSVGAEGLAVANACMIMRSYGDNTFVPYEYQELDYIPGAEEYPPVDRSIFINVFMNDYWGHNYEIDTTYFDVPQIFADNWFSMGTDTRKHNNLENSTQRLNQLGMQSIIFTDFVWVDEDLSLSNENYPGLNLMTQEDMNRLVSVSKENGLDPVLGLSIIDPLFMDQLVRYFNSAEYGSYYEVAGPIQVYDRFNLGEATQTLHQNWRAAILEEAQMAETAGFSALFAKDNTGWMNTGEYVELDNQEMKQTIAEVRKVFSGKLGAKVLDVDELSVGYDFYSLLDFVVIEIGVDKIISGLDENDIQGHIDAWKHYLTDPVLDVLAEVPEVVLSLGVNSYDGVIDGGWIEAAGHYPDLVRDDREQALIFEAFFRTLYEVSETNVNGVQVGTYDWHDYIYPNLHDIRNDLGTSIRGKDAEHVFHRWTQTFQ